MKELLNQQQRRAVEAPDGPVLIVAGPGTGKTRTLVARINYLAAQGTPDKQILALTFTNKAAREMQARVSGIKPHITTFHALGRRLLTELRGEAPSLVSNPERQQIIRGLKKSQAIKGLSVRELELYISGLKNQPEPAAFDPLLDAYQKALTGRGFCDFDDLLLDLRDLLQRDHTLHQRYRAVLVDEFQDTNALQYELLKLLGSSGNLFVIGDPLQSIYGFRGASAEVFERFRRDWPEALSITLGTNYRSAPQVVELAGQIFPDASKLTAHRQDNGQIRCLQVLNEYSEARHVISTIEQNIGGSTMLAGSQHHTAQHGAKTFGDFAVLYRTHRTVVVLRRLLDESGLPHQIVGEGSPYAREPVTAIIHELKNSQARDLPVSRLIARKAENLGFDTQTPDIRMLINAAVRFDTAGLQAYLQYLESIAEQEFYDPAADAITLLTIHAAKGLEFEHVFLIGAEEGLIPHKRPHAISDPSEERRLFYVAVTRAKNQLDLLHTKTRASKPAKLSEFVAAIPSQILPRRTDPAMADEQRRSQKRAFKRNQTTLF